MIRSIALLTVFALSLAAVPSQTVKVYPAPIPTCYPNCPFIK